MSGSDPTLRSSADQVQQQLPPSHTDATQIAGNGNDSTRGDRTESLATHVDLAAADGDEQPAPITEDGTVLEEQRTDVDIEGTLIEDVGAAQFSADEDVTELGAELALGTADDDPTVISVVGQAGDEVTEIDALSVAAAPESDATLLEEEQTIVVGEQTLLEDFGTSSAEPSSPTRLGEGPHPEVPTQIVDKGDEQSSRYVLVDDFAQGGLGKIWRAEDVRIRREVAYKELLPGALKNSAVVERFVEEAQITGQLEHPGIVPIYDLGWQANGTPFYSMKLVRGITLKDAIQRCHALPRESSERRLAFVKLLRNLVAVCNAVGFAHDRNVLHRDLKPQNIMLGDFGETLVLDWGLAKIIGDRETGNGPDDDPAAGHKPVSAAGDEHAPYGATILGSLLPDAIRVDSAGDDATQEDELSVVELTEVEDTAGTRTERRTVQTGVRSAQSRTIFGSVMGTPAYMPPEQALGRLDDLDPRTDVYALGAILYEILLNRAPIARSTTTEMLKQVIRGEITAPRQQDPAVPKALEAICLRALAKDRTGRYPTALALAADVEAWLADEPVSAYPEPWHTRLRRWVKRHRTLVTASAAVLSVLVVGLAGWSIVESRRIASLRATVEGKLTDARAALETNAFTQAQAFLNEASGLVSAEPALAMLTPGIEGIGETVSLRQAALEVQRVAELRQSAEQKVSAAQQAIDERQDYESAVNVLTEVSATLANEPALAELRTDVDARRAAAVLAIGERRAVTDAQARFTTFQERVDRARFFGSLFTGENVDQDSREAQQQALGALADYGLDQGSSQPSKVEHLAPEQVETIRSDAYELFLILAETETTLARHSADDVRRAAAERALEWVNRAKSLEITSKAALLREAGYLEALGRTEARDAALAAARRTTPATALDFFLLAESERKSRRYEEALVLYQSALGVDPEHFWSMNFLALSHLQLDEPDAAIAGYTACIAARPDFVWCYITRGYAYGRVGQFDRALEDFARAIELEPTRMEIFLNRGVVHMRREDFESAVADFRRASELRADKVGPLINLGEAYRRQDKLEDALQTLTKAESLEPNNPKTYGFRGFVKLALGDVAGARRDFERSIELDDDPQQLATSYRELGQIEHRAQRWPAAVEFYDRALAADPDAADTIRLRAEALLAWGRDEDAVAAFSRWLELSEPTGDVYRARGLALAKLGRYREAINDYTLSLQLESSPNMLTRRGWAYLLEANRLALEDFDEAIRLNPQNSDSYNGRGYAKVLLGDHAGAAGDAEQAVNWAEKQAASQGPRTWVLFFNAATIYAQGVSQATIDTRLSEAERPEVTQRYTLRAVELLRRAFEIAGARHRLAVDQLLKADRALDPIRDTPEFQGAFASQPASAEDATGTEKPGVSR